VVTIKDVAQAAGVSITTVSHTINGTRRVSDELKTRVLQAMQELDYRPNVLARSLRVGQTKTTGLIIPDNSNFFFAEIARAIEDIGYQHGYSVILCNSDGKTEKQRRYIQTLADKKVDGVIFISSGETAEDVEYLKDNEIEVVAVDRDLPHMPADVVLLDNELAGYQATRYLIDLGHRRIACISGPSNLTPSAQRVDGYRRAMQEASLELNPAHQVVGDFQTTGGEAGIARLLGLRPRPSAAFVCNDMMAIGAIRAARCRGVQVPEDLSIVGFDDIALARAMSPALTTMAQPILEIARIATELLIRRMQGELDTAARQRIVLRAQLVIRDSCMKCPAEKSHTASRLSY
jgi:LacI family transcriptional regulator